MIVLGVMFRCLEYFVIYTWNFLSEFVPFEVYCVVLKFDHLGADCFEVSSKWFEGYC